MDALQPDPSASGALPQQRDAASSGRSLERWIALAVGGLALAINPLSIRLLTHRTELGFRPLVLGVVFDVFLLLVAGALFTSGNRRRVFFHFIAWTLPFVAIAGLEVIAGAVHLSQHIATFQDLSVIKRGNHWGPGISHLAPQHDGFLVYRPWSGDGVTINDLGLRTTRPAPKQQGEYRIAVVGSSETFGTRLADADTIPALLQAALRRTGRDQISVYNFGIEDSNMAKGLALLRHFKDIYRIDHVVFMTGGGDVMADYLDIEGQPLGITAGGIASFELYKTIELIRATWFEPAATRLARFDARFQEQWADKKNRLVDGIKAANDYCRATSLRCDFILQPLLVGRRSLAGTEVQLAQTYRRLYPRFDMLAKRSYRDALDPGLDGGIHDLTTVFDDSRDQYYFDGGHVNEAGNAIVVDALLPIVTQSARWN
jgi:lysophospholipase L1-like esterase